MIIFPLFLFFFLLLFYIIYVNYNVRVAWHTGGSTRIMVPNIAYKSTTRNANIRGEMHAH